MRHRRNNSVPVLNYVAYGIIQLIGHIALNIIVDKKIKTDKYRGKNQRNKNYHQ